MSAKICADCRRELEIGDRYIEDAPSAFMGREPDVTDSLMAEIFGGQGDKIVYCEDCTQNGGHWQSQTYYGEEETDDPGR